MGAKFFINGVMTLPNGGNRWLSHNGLPYTLYGQILRDLDFASLKKTVLPVINWIDYTQYTWAVNGMLRQKIGQENEPVIALFPAPSGLHYSPVFKHRVAEYLDWSANWVTVRDSKEGVWGRHT